MKQDIHMSAMNDVDEEERMLHSPSTEEQESEVPAAISSIKRCLYTSHLLSTWNARMFEYGAVLFLAHIYDESFVALSLYALARSLASVLFSPRVGQYIDARERLVAARHSIVYQRSAVILSCLAFFGMIAFPSKTIRGGLLLLLIGCACVERLCAVMNLLLVERDWVVVIASGDDHLLTQLNSQMRRIDLLCKLVGPLAISFVDSFFSLTMSVLFVFVLNFGCVFIEYYTIAKVHSLVPALQKKSHIEQEEQGTRSSMRTPWSDVKFYMGHPIFLASFALSILYFTVLSFGPQMVALLLFKGIDPAAIGTVRAGAVVMELSATWIAPRMMDAIGSKRAGSVFISYQSLCLIVALSLFLTVWGPGGTWILVGGVILSRMGLWGFDLCVQVEVQKGVEEQNRSRFSAMESSLQSAFDLMSYVVTIIWSQPEQFHYPASISVGAVLTAAVTYLRYASKGQQH